MKKSLMALGLALCLLGGCAAGAALPARDGPKRYEASFLTLFDTVTTVVGYAESEEEFRETAQQFHDCLEEYHQLNVLLAAVTGAACLALMLMGVLPPWLSRSSLTSP